MLHAKDLMIGDWVKFPIGNDKVVDLPYIEGRGICASFAASATLFPVEIDKIEPIPLTPEILKKNGYKDTWGWYKLDDCPFWLVKYAEKSWARGKFGVMFNEDDSDPSFLIGSVHELQHALRLCGIEKEIEL